ncbi:MAG: tRNA (adenosine(37)-N6)-threonylcarbamoyltransferase complex dimerization subunit type 1 TsaB [Nitrospirae bacterium]|jgi:tRNA threonylcarbamoyladenosine biosynthesis protein TsaB|nr:tRNA (adenosine(37)-N6)-threonylcarbamoyltransferase complex dimerization subunit type 1 TsaB [Nitrospirota bacterium]MCL5259240.1 tRNA (adenosine(37)-N6)-threonylcarbamoyltransferase complex dimerization subunit type 1 TsaB [Nitrospirota bacterium]
MIHLAVETSTDLLSMALLEDGRVLGEVRIRATKGASEILVQALDLLLVSRKVLPASIGMVSCSRGPGSYTSLRVGFMFCQGFSEATGADLLTLCPFEVLAREWKGSPGTLLLAVLNARQGQVTAALMEDGCAVDPVFSPLPENPADLVRRLPGSSIRIVGPGRSLIESWRVDHPEWIWKEGEDVPPLAGSQGTLAWERRNLCRDEVGLVYGRAPV